jgi:hypothetical protein
MKKRKEKNVFVTAALYIVAVCVLSVIIGVAFGIFFYDVSPALSNRNVQQKKDFETSKRVLDLIDAEYAAKFETEDEARVKMRLARQGLTALLEAKQIHTLYGYDEIEHILANRASETRPVVVNAKSYNWPTIRLISMMYDASMCTTMVEFSGGEVTNEQRRQVWKWVRKDGKWIPTSFSNYFAASDIEISKQGISFMLSVKNDPKLSKLFVLKK